MMKGRVVLIERDQFNELSKWADLVGIASIITGTGILSAASELLTPAIIALSIIIIGILCLIKSMHQRKFNKWLGLTGIIITFLGALSTYFTLTVLISTFTVADAPGLITIILTVLFIPLIEKRPWRERNKWAGFAGVIIISMGVLLTSLDQHTYQTALAVNGIIYIILGSKLHTVKRIAEELLFSDEINNKTNLLILNLNTLIKTQGILFLTILAGTAAILLGPVLTMTLFWLSIH